MERMTPAELRIMTREDLEEGYTALSEMWADQGSSLTFGGHTDLHADPDMATYQGEMAAIAAELRRRRQAVPVIAPRAPEEEAPF